MKQLINNPGTVVTEAIHGLVKCHPHLQRLDGFPDIKVVFDRAHDKTKVAVISGGGSGHEPAHAGYVGVGMLTAAVCGEVFASPSADAVLAAIRTVTGTAGCLLVRHHSNNEYTCVADAMEARVADAVEAHIIKNYTGDRLHFGLAAEQAKAEGFNVAMVVVGEDVAIPEPGLAGRRGLAGTALVHKAAGAVAASGASLSEVVKVARQVAEALGTLGVALKVCTLPGKEASDRLGDDEIEIGLGIHGEPGTSKIKAMPADQLVRRMVDHISSSRHFGDIAKGQRFVLLVNNLGGTTSLELSIVAESALSCIEQSGVSIVAESALSCIEQSGASVDRILVGPYMTSLDMAGMSITLLRLSSDGMEAEAVLKLLDAPTGAPGWPATSALLNTQPVAPLLLGASKHSAADSVDMHRSDQLSLSGKLLEDAITAAAEAILKAAPMLDELDRKVGDGDCGSTLATGARAILQDVKSKYHLNDPAITAQQLARTIRSAVGGSSGALYDIMVTAAARTLKAQGQDTQGRAAAWSQALAAGTAAVQEYGGATPGCRTMLDALAAATVAAIDACSKGLSAGEVATLTAKAALMGAESTKSMSATAGRSSYVPSEVLAEVPDPGAVAVAIWIQAVATVFSN
ncbi:hypothetical protein CEUSTIGMA_g3395.t1 [Chlamydomonas eustigma]|uniref:Dihydroxyacetone kinase n=1 Tax=Chlamydomonas eustigma TaxID=1157962 RepID=A0A250WZA9_9CHLO|nr:hypothetical protein CEUSTIGMA_g3395.t1 [Chlamydomonas eustigma]|eukprot:GAX75952.1 hypothetical protein CEUSTIGMA_g3395.t1 [Chlamydomonas eustigma]